MPRIIVQAFEGRSVDQKRSLIRGITDAVVEAFTIPASEVIVVIEEMKPENYGAAGVMRADVLAQAAEQNGSVK